MHELIKSSTCNYAVYKTDMELQIVKKRAKRALLVNYCTLVNQELESEGTITTIKLERYVNELNKRARQVAEIHESLTELVEEGEIENLLSEQETWFENQMKEVDVLNERIASLRESLTESQVADHNAQIVDHNAPPGSTASGSDQSETRALNSGIKLTKLELATFDGVEIDNFSDYREDHYTNVYNNKDLSPVVKMSYLRRTLKGDAYRMISGFTLTEEDYEVAWHLLCQRYGRFERVAMRHISALLHLEPVKQGRGQEYVNGIYKLYNEINLHVRSLKNVLTTLKAEDILIPLIISKFPNNFLHEYSKLFKSKDANLKGVLNFLEGECQRYEYVNDIFCNMGENPTHKEKIAKTTTQPRGSAVALQVSTEDTFPAASATGNKTRSPCVYCKGDHPSRSCNRFWNASLGDRREMVLTAGLCFRCLNSGHRAANCRKTCKVCGGEHATPLCNTNTPTSRKNTKRSADNMIWTPQDFAWPNMATGQKQGMVNFQGQQSWTPWNNYAQQNGMMMPGLPVSGTSGALVSQQVFTPPTENPEVGKKYNMEPSMSLNTQNQQVNKALGFRQVQPLQNPPGDTPSTF